MITAKDFRNNFLLFGVVGYLNILPIEVDVVLGRLKLQQNSRRNQISQVIFGLVVLHGAYVNWKLANTALFSREKIVRHHLVFHVDIAAGAIMVFGWYTICFIIWPKEFITVFNNVFANSDVQNTATAKARRTRQEWLALCMPWLLSATVIFILLTYIYDRTLGFLLYALLPPKLQTPLCFLMLLPEELLLVTFVALTTGLVLSAHLLFFEKISGDLLNLRKLFLRERCTQEEAERNYTKLRLIQITVSWFNNINRYITFSFKLYCITMCTINGYFMIAYFSADPIFGTIYYVAFIVLSMTYSIMYERAFAIPTMLRVTAKSMVLWTETSQLSSGLKLQFKRQIQSIPSLGIQVGRFHTFERVATPVFVDYVLRNVLGLLMMNHPQ